MRKGSDKPVVAVEVSVLLQFLILITAKLFAKVLGDDATTRNPNAVLKSAGNDTLRIMNGQDSGDRADGYVNVEHGAYGALKVGCSGVL